MNWQIMANDETFNLSLLHRPIRRSAHHLSVPHHRKMGIAARGPQPHAKALEVFVVVINIAIVWFNGLADMLGYPDHGTLHFRIFGYRERRFTSRSGLHLGYWTAPHTDERG